MHGFMTTGTGAFLQTIIEKNTDKDFHFMKNGTKALLYYEDTKKKGIFVSGKTGEILYDAGNLALKGFVVMYHIPVTEGETAVFEDKIDGRLHKLSAHPNVMAIRLLREKNASHYIIMIQWKSEQDYHHWKKFSDAVGLDFSKMAKLPAYFADRPFTNTYYMVQEEA